MPTMPRAAHVMIAAELLFGGLEAIFDRPAVPFNGDERRDSRAGRALSREVDQITIADITAGKVAAGPDA